MSMFHSPRKPAAILRAKARRSHAWWKTGSFSSRSIGPRPCIPPMSWMPFIAARHVLALPAHVAELGDRLRAVLQQPHLVGGVRPGAREDVGAVAPPHLRLVRVDESVERGRVDQALLDEQRLERPHPQLGLGE